MRRLLLMLLVACLTAASDDQPKLFLAVYYESKCPDSQKFIAEQLVPAMGLLQEHVMLQLVPFGKAHSIDNGCQGFECQHGQTECLGNIVQSCALHYMHERPESEWVNYVACEMKTLAGTSGNLTCVENANVPVDLVRQCMTAPLGTELQLGAEYLTKLVSPKFIPTVTINEVFNQQIQDDSQVNLIGVLCSLIKDAPACTTEFNHQVFNYVLL